MYYSWRITKYNPEHRDTDGRYLIDEWTSISDIGKTFAANGKKLSAEKYLKIEDAYVKAVAWFMKVSHTSCLKVQGLEKHGTRLYVVTHRQLYGKELYKLYSTIKDGNLLDIHEIEAITRLILRERLWCRLENPSIFVHFGYDYYMYIGGTIEPELVIPKIKEIGLYVEPFISPHHPEEE